VADHGKPLTQLCHNLGPRFGRGREVGAGRPRHPSSSLPQRSIVFPCLIAANPSEELITGGLYGISRNPIALGMMFSAFGLFLALPNVLTFAIVNLALLLFQVRIRLEEGHLDDLHGEAYLEYRRSTGRWLGRRGTP
jgi:hypothetical protein